MKYDLDQVPEFARGRARQRLQQARRLGSHREPGKGEFHAIAFWLHSLPAEQPKLAQKLHKLTWAQAVEAQAKWHRMLAHRVGRCRAFGGAPDDVKTVLDVPLGRRWVVVETRKGRDYEGNAMGHCVGSERYEDRRILSLRDGDNLSHRTVEWDPNTRVIAQIRGRANEAIVATYHDDIRRLVEHLGPSKARDAIGLGHVWVQSEGGAANLRPIASLRCSLRPGDVIVGDICVRDSDLLSALPRGAHIRGDVTVSNCPSFESLPGNLTISGDLCLRQCERLLALPDGLVLSGHLVLIGCRYLTSLPDHISVGGNLYLRSCVALGHLPQGLTVGGNSYPAECPSLASLPGGLSIGGDLYLGERQALPSLPKGLTVSGSLIMRGSTSLSALPDGLTVGRHLFLKGCTELASLPEGLKVGDELDLRDCVSSHAMPSRYRVGGKIQGRREDRRTMPTMVSGSGLQWVGLRKRTTRPHAAALSGRANDGIAGRSRRNRDRAGPRRRGMDRPPRQVGMVRRALAR